MRPRLIKSGQFHGHKDCIYTLAPGLQSGELLSAGAEGVIARWNLETEEAVALAQTQAPVYALKLLPEAGLLLVGLANGQMLFLDVKSGQIIKNLEVHQSGIFDIQVFPGQEFALASSADGQLSVFNLEKRSLEHLARISEKSIRTVHFHPDRPWFYAGSSDAKIRMLDLNLKLVREWQAHETSVFRLQFLPDRKTLVSAGRDAQINFWDGNKTFSRLENIPAHMYAINDLVLSANQRWLFSGSMDKSIKVWDWETRKLVRVVDFARHECHRNGINRLLWHDGSLFSCGDDRLVMRWELELPLEK